MSSAGKKFKKLITNWDDTKASLIWMKNILSPFRKYVLIILLINVFSLVVSYIGTITGKYIVDATTEGTLSLGFIGIMLSASVLSILFSAGVKILSDYINEKFTFSIRADAYDNVQRTFWRNISSFHSGDIVTRLTSDISTLSTGLISTLPGIIFALLQLLISFFILFYYDKALAFFALLLGPVGALLSVFVRRKYKQYQLELRESESEYRSFMQESMSNIAVIKSFEQEDYCNEYIKEIRDKRLKTIIKNSRLTAVMNTLARLIYSVGYVIAFAWCAYRLATDESFTYGTLTIFISMFSQIQGSVGGLVHIVPQTYTLLISAGRIRAIADLEHESYEKVSDIPSEVGFRAENISFSYDDATEQVLQNLSLNVKPGERIGIVGSSGAGKTTFIRLLLSLIEPNEGKMCYYYDGKEEPVSAATRRLITYVPQGNTLFSGTIERNLRTGKADATEDEMWAALEIAGAAKFVRRTEHGLNTDLTEHAGGLSEGQAQRIAIARALLRDTPILILDEATSALDETTESQVLKRITENLQKTCFIITHRRSMLKYCDSVLEILDDGTAHIKETAREA